METNFVCEWHVTKIVTLHLEVHWPSVVILSWWHKQKTEKCTSSECSAKFLLGVSNHSYMLSDFLEKKSCHLSLTCHLFCLQNICHAACFTHNQNFFIRKKLRHIWCGDTCNLQMHFFFSVDHIRIGPKNLPLIRNLLRLESTCELLRSPLSRLHKKMTGSRE